MKLFRFSTFLFPAFLSAGCMGSAALITYPDSLSLNPEPSRYLELSMDVLIGGKPNHIDYSWECEHKKHFTASKMGWVLSWQSERRVIAKQTDDGKTLFFWQPSYCEVDSDSFETDLLLTKGERQPASVTLFDTTYDIKQLKTESKAITNGVIRRVQTPSTLGKMTAKEEKLAASMTKSLNNYVVRNVRVASKEAWQSNATLVQVFSKLTKTTHASEVIPPGSRLLYTFSHLRKFREKWERPTPLRHYTPILQNKKLVLDEQPLKAKDKVFYLESRNACKNEINFCYTGQCLPLRGAITNEVYYPATQELVSISCTSLRHAFK